MRQALAFTPDKERCKGFKATNDVKFNVRTEYATPFRRQMAILLDNMIRLANINLARKIAPAQATTPRVDRLVIERSPLQVLLERGDDRMLVRRHDDYVLMSSRAVPRVADEAHVDETRAQKLVDMYPIFPTIDMRDEHVYDPSKPLVVGWPSPAATSAIHADTVFHINDDTPANLIEREWTSEQDMARLLVFAYAHAIAQSRRHNAV